MSIPTLPPDSEGQIFVKVQALSVGGLSIPHRNMFQDSINEPLSVRSDAPCFAFLITHPTRGKALFDMGLRKNVEGYPPAAHARAHDYFHAYCDADVAEVLSNGGIRPSEIQRIILSHLHWDHWGDPTSFTSAEIVLGGESKRALETAYPTNPDSPIQSLPADRKAVFVDFSAIGVISPFATFERAVDLYGDGSLYLVDAPGHMPGHMVALARVAPNSFICLAGDTCHHHEAYKSGTRLLSELQYADIETARATVERLAELDQKFENVVVIIAHDAERWKTVPMFPEDLANWMVGEVERRSSVRRVA